MKVLRVLCCVVTLVAFSSPSVAQWSKIGQFSVSINSGWFWDQQNGLLGSGHTTIPLAVSIWKTTDGGTTWTASSIPPGYNGSVSQIFMVSRDTGWASVLPWGSGKTIRLWKTVDGGSSWFEVGQSGTGDCVYQTSKALIETDLSPSVKGGYSTDGGVTFHNVFVGRTTGIDFTDDLNGIVTVFREGPWLATSDGGLTWTSLSMTDEAWSVYAVKGTNTYYTAGENYGGPTSIVKRSTNHGITWTTQSTFGFQTTGHIAGAGPDLYVQTANTSPHPSGVLKSTDNGATWTDLSGPRNWFDSRFCVAGCESGRTIIAFDDLGGVFELVEGAGAPQVLYSTDLRDFGSISDCFDRDTFLVISNRGCGPFHVTGATISGPDFQLIGFNPSTVLPGQSDTIHVRFHPQRGQQSHGLVSVSMDAPGTPGADFNLAGSGYESNFASVDSSLRDFGFVSPCLTRDTIIAVHNTGCDTIDLSDAVITGSDFTITAASIGAIPPGGVGWIQIRYTPGTSNLTLAKLHIVTTSRNEPTVDIRLRAQTADRRMVSVDSSRRNFGLVPPCASASSILLVRNIGCDTVHVSDTSLSGEGYVVVGMSGLAIPPGGCDTVVISFSPQHSGVSSGQLTLRTDAPRADPISILLQANSSSSRAISIDSAARNFGHVADCQSKDTFLVVTNVGCDTLHVSDLSIQGGSFQLLTDSLNAIPPKSTDTIWITFHPEEPGVATGWLSFRTDAGADSAVSIQLQASGEPSRTLALDDLDRDFGTVDGCHGYDTVIVLTNPGCDTVSILELSEVGDRFHLLSSTNARLAPGQTDTLRIQYDPSRMGDDSGYVIIRSNASSGSNYQVRLHGKSAPSHLYSIGPAFLDLGLLPACTDKDTFLVVRNEGCDTVRVRSVTCVSEEFGIDSGYQTIVAPGTADTIWIRYTWKSARSGSAEVDILMDADTTANQHKIGLTVTSQRSSALFARNTQIDFGRGTSCRSADSEIVLQNPGCDTLYITSSSLIGSSFTLLDSLPRYIAPGEYDTVHVHFTADVGASDGELTVQSDANSNATVKVRLSGFGNAPRTITLLPRFSRQSVEAGDTTTLWIFPSESVSGSGLHRLQFQLVHNQVLIPVSLTSPSGLQLSTSVSANRESVWISGADIHLDPSIPLLTAVYRTAVSTVTGTDVKIDSIGFNDFDQDFRRCILDVVTDSDALEMTGCGIKLLREAMSGAPIRITTLEPNPVSRSKSIRVTLQSALAGSAHLTVTDILGRPVYEDEIQTELEHPYEIEILTIGLPSGMYTVTVTTANRYSTHRQFLIQN